MKKFSILFFIVLFGWLGWELGEQWGIGVAYALSTIGSIVGVIVGWWINQKVING